MILHDDFIFIIIIYYLMKNTDARARKKQTFFNILFIMIMKAIYEFPNIMEKIIGTVIINY